MDKTKNSGIIKHQRIRDDQLAFARRLRKTMTPAEIIVWAHVRNRKQWGLKFRRQQIVCGFYADFYCDEARLSIEFDGGIHNTPEQKRKDALKDRVFIARGIQVIRIRNESLYADRDGCLSDISEACRNRAI